MGLRQRLSDLFWPPEFGGDQPVEAKPAAASSDPSPSVADRLKRVGISDETRKGTPHRAGVAERLRQVGLPDLDLKEVERRQRIHETSRDAERRGRRQAAYERSIPSPCRSPARCVSRTTSSWWRRAAAR
ncbi:MAG: hypothetical protein E6I76_12910 [Chloroflexi bacterium]|nr:MAG: hypothetical protein E6I76_12910 [Chloroflexota bacterium]